MVPTKGALSEHDAWLTSVNLSGSLLGYPDFRDEGTKKLCDWPKVKQVVHLIVRCLMATGRDKVFQ